MELVRDLAQEWDKIPDVMVIDDEMALAKLFQQVLNSAGCNVDIATSSDEAIEKITYRGIIERPYDIIFLDLIVPPQHGPTILKHIRDVMPEVPVVIVTGYPDSEKVKEAMRYGFFGLVKKPLDFEELKVIFSRHRIHLPK